MAGYGEVCNWIQKPCSMGPALIRLFRELQQGVGGVSGVGRGSVPVEYAENNICMTTIIKRSTSPDLTARRHGYNKMQTDAARDNPTTIEMATV